MWEDLQRTDLSDAQIRHADDYIFDQFMWTLHWFKGYATEASLTSRTGWSDRTIRKHLWAMAKKIQALAQNKIVWPPEWDDPSIDTQIFLISVDGTHCKIFEPSHGEYSKNPKYYSHKFRMSALAYEVAISVFTNQVVWINGPFPAGKGDADIFDKYGLKARLPPGKK